MRSTSDQHRSPPRNDARRRLRACRQQKQTKIESSVIESRLTYILPIPLNGGADDDVTDDVTSATPDATSSLQWTCTSWVLLRSSRDAQTWSILNSYALTCKRLPDWSYIYVCCLFVTTAIGGSLIYTDTSIWPRLSRLTWWSTSLRQSTHFYPRPSRLTWGSTLLRGPAGHPGQPGEVRRSTNLHTSTPGHPGQPGVTVVRRSANLRTFP
jgi:hypothetical protein